MDEKTTPVKSDEQLIDLFLKNKGASQRTLDLLRKLSRCYYAESSLPKDMDALCLN